MPDVLFEVKDSVGIITLNRPDIFNSINRPMVETLIDLTQQIERDPAIRAVLFQAAGNDFMAGADVKGFHDALVEDREGHAAGMEAQVITGHLVIHRMRRMPKPVIVAVQGACLGFGVSLMLAADLAIGGENAYLVVAYRHVGLSTDGGATYFLPRIIGERRALEMTLLGERIEAKQALDWGLFNRLAPPSELHDQAFDMAKRLAAGPTRALAGSKRLLRGSLQSTWDEQSAREAETIMEMFASDDHLEGVTAFLEKRRPLYTGQ